MNEGSNQIFGEIIRIDSVNTYLVKVPSESSFELGLGEFVGVDSGDGMVVCVIKGVQRSIPEELATLISFEQELKYLPYNTDFKSSYYIVFGLNMLSDDIKYRIHTAPQIRAPVKRLNKETIRKFHLKDNKPNISYFNQYRETLGDCTLLAISDELMRMLPEASSMLLIVKKYIEGSGKI